MFRNPAYLQIDLTGLFGVYFVTDPKKVQDMSYHVMDKMVRMCHQLSEDELERAKTQLKSNMLTQVILGVSMIAVDLTFILYSIITNL